MNRRSAPFLSAAFAALALLASCSGGSPAAGSPPAAPTPPEVARLQLAAKPAGAVSVVEAKKAGPGERVVTGRIANVVRGFAVLTLIDTSLPYCGEKNKEDDCKTPWDYCCETAETRSAHSIVVEARGADGKPLRAQSLPELRLLDVVTATGRLQVDEHGNHVLVATGWHRDARPELPAGLRWPE
jgi:hypothetical protein